MGTPSAITTIVRSRSIWSTRKVHVPSEPRRSLVESKHVGNQQRLPLLMIITSFIVGKGYLAFQTAKRFDKLFYLCLPTLSVQKKGCIKPNHLQSDFNLLATATNHERDRACIPGPPTVVVEMVVLYTQINFIVIAWQVSYVPVKPLNCIEILDSLNRAQFTIKRMHPDCCTRWPYQHYLCWFYCVGHLWWGRFCRIVKFSRTVCSCRFSTSRYNRNWANAIMRSNRKNIKMNWIPIVSYSHQVIWILSIWNWFFENQKKILSQYLGMSLVVHNLIVQSGLQKTLSYLRESDHSPNVLDRV